MRYKDKEIAPSGDPQYIIAFTLKELTALRAALIIKKSNLRFRPEEKHSKWAIVTGMINGINDVIEVKRHE